MKKFIRHSSSALTISDIKSVLGVALRNFPGNGPLCDSLRKEIRNLTNAKGVMLTDSGTSALMIALATLKKNYPEKNEVILSIYVCPSVVSSIMLLNLVPIFIDLRRDRMNFDTTSISRHCNNNTLAIISTNIGGIPDDFDSLKMVSIPLISDCAQALGSTYNDSSLSKYGMFSVFSFGPTKVISGGTGGSLSILTEKFTDYALEYGREELDVNAYTNSGFVPTLGQHFSDVNAGIVLSQLAKLRKLINRRRKIAEEYDDALSKQVDVLRPLEGPKEVFNRYRYYFFSERATDWINMLQSQGIDARNSISHNIATYTRSEEFPNCMYLSRSLVSLPIYSQLTNGEVGRIARLLQRGLR